MSLKITNVDNDGVKTRDLPEKEFGYDNYVAGGDLGRVSIGTSEGGSGKKLAFQEEVVLKDSVQALAETNSLDITGQTLTVTKGDGTSETATIPTSTAPVASETISGTVELATIAEAQTGTDTTRAVTPAGLSAVSIPTSRFICGDIQFTGSDVEITDAVALYSTFNTTDGYKQTKEVFSGTQTVVWNNGLGADGFKYGKKIEGVSGYTRVDNKPVFNEVSATTEYRIGGNWYDATGTKLPPQSYIEDADGNLAIFEVVSSLIVGITKGDYVPSIVENAINVKSLTITDEFDLVQTWQDVTASRSAGVTYTNTTGKPIKVAIRTATVAADASLNIDGLPIHIVFDDASGTVEVVMSEIVPNGSTYSMTDPSSRMQKWHELR